MGTLTLFYPTVGEALNFALKSPFKMATTQSTQLGLAPHSSSSPYRGRDPELTFLYQVVRENWLTFQAHTEALGKTLPLYVENEFEALLKCGVLAHGFVRLKCENCRHEKLVAFSCKKRGFCPSCAGRRMAESGIFLTEEVFPHVPVRQWVVSFPIPLRYWMASNPKLMGLVLGIVTRAIASFYRVRAKSYGVRESRTGTVTIIQRFGGSVNLNIHLHQLWMEGVFVKADPEGTPTYRWVHRPRDQDVTALLTLIRNRVVRLLVKKGYLDKNEMQVSEAENRDENDNPVFAQIQAASTQNKIALGDRSGQRVRRVGSFGNFGEKPELTGELCGSLGGFSIHANVYIEADKRDKLEKLCRYVSRPPVAESRLRKLDNGDVGYFLKTQWNDGTIAVRFSPLEFIEKLVALVPQPRIHLIRYHGVFAPHHSWRAQIVPKRTVGTQGTNYPIKPKKPSRHRHSFAELLKRVFNIDLTTCPDCGGAVKFISAIMKRDVVVKILNHLGLSTTLPEFTPARAPPNLAFNL